MDRDKALDVALGQIEKQFGKGAIMRLGEESQQRVPVIPSGALALDVALGTGGFPRGRVVEIYGPESSGKTTLALHAIAEAQKLGGIAAFIDAEHALDPVYARALGVDTESLLVSQPDTGEQALEITDTLVRSAAVDLVVIDSVAALTPRAEIEGEMGDTHVGLQARLMSQALRKLAGHLSRSRTCCIFINQLREKVGVMFGSPEVTPGGRALKFYASVRLDVRRIESLKDGTDFVGNRVRVKVVKNKCVAEGTQVFDPATGRVHAIEEIVDQGLDVHVWAADKKGELNVRPVTALHDQGVQDVMGLRLRNGTVLRVTPDHRILTEEGWRRADAIVRGDRVARPRRAGGFGTARPYSADEARLVGYLIGDGYVGGKTPVAFINAAAALHDDVRNLAEARGCAVKIRDDGSYASISHRPGERNGVLELVRRAGICGHLAWEKVVPPELFAPDVAADVVGNLLFGIWESDGWISREQNGGMRLGFSTTSHGLATQIQWLLLRWGITSTVAARIEARRTTYQVRISGIDNLRLFSDAVPAWGPKGTKLRDLLAEPWVDGRRGSRAGYVAMELFSPITAHLADRGVSPAMAASLLGLGTGHAQGGYRAVLGAPRVRRDRLQQLADALDDPYLSDLLSDDLYFEAVHEVLHLGPARTFDLTVEGDHNFVADGVVVHNCAPPFRQAEMDILFGEGISTEGSLIDMSVEHGIVRKAGAWYTYEGEQLGQGRENARAFLKEHADVAAEISKKVIEAAGLVPTDVAPAAGEIDDL